jgi:hypothetical protein
MAEETTITIASLKEMALRIDECPCVPLELLIKLGNSIHKFYEGTGHIVPPLLAEAYIEYRSRSKSPIIIEDKLVVQEVTSIESEFIKFLSVEPFAPLHRV